MRRLVGFFALIAACSSNSAELQARLVGRWTDLLGAENLFTFNADGTFNAACDEVLYARCTSRTLVSGTFRVEDDQLLLNYDGAEEGGTIYLTDRYLGLRAW